MTNKEEMEFALQWIDDHVDDMGFLPAHLLAFAKDFIQAHKSQISTIPIVSDLLPLDLQDRIKLGKQMQEWDNRRGKIYAINQLEAMLREVNMTIAKKQ